MLADLITLTKPRITLLCLLMYGGGYVYATMLASEATGVFSWEGVLRAVDWLALWGLLGTWAAVASANTLNMVWERKSDGLMARTAQRPLPSGRLSVFGATAFGLVLAGLALLFLSWVNGVTALLGIVALLGYVLVYTPLKRITPHALIVGAVPGALPPLMGWTTHTGRVDAVGLVLFGILLLWQVPHFIAIAVSHKADYQRAGIQVRPLVSGEKRAVQEALVYSLLLLVTSLLLVPLAKAGLLYLLGASLLGLWIVLLCLRGLRSSSPAWARSVFLASLAYLPLLTGVLIVDVVIRSAYG